MNDVSFALTAIQPPDPDGSAELEIRIGQTVLTRLLRSHEQVADCSLRCPSAPLAFWFADNWWRHRWESRPIKPSADWRMTHEMTAIGHGNAWPNVTLWGDRERVMLISKADAPGVVGPVRFLNSAITYASAAQFEAAIDTMLDRACRIVPNGQRESLLALLGVLRNERADPGVSAWRRLEAVNGYLPDQAPESLIEDLLALEDRFSAADVEEAAAAAAGEGAAECLNAALVAAERGARVEFSEALGLTRSRMRATERLEPWIMAEASAQMLREALGHGAAPLRQRVLSELLGMSPRHMASRTVSEATPYALRLAKPGKAQLVLITAKWAHDRRFQAARMLGDAIWSGCSALGVVSTLGSARQKFQRAFAAALLCPAQGLLEFFGSAAPGDEDIAGAARYFHVSEKTVRSVLVNKDMIERHRLGGPLVDPQGSLSLDALTDAA